MKTKPSELKQNLFKAGIGLVAFGFAAAGHELTGPLTALVGLAGNVASQFGIEACMPYITKNWLSHPDKVVNHHIQRALVTAVNTALTEIEQEYLVRDDVSPREQQSLRDFFAVLRSRSEQEFMEAARDELTKQEILDYVYDRQAAARHLQDRLRIQLDSSADDEFYFTDRFIAYFPGHFAERVQFHLKEELKGEDEDQEKAKKAMDLLFFETLRAGLNDLKIGQADLKTSLDTALETGTRTAQQLDFYGELWISAIRQNRAQLDRVEENTQKTLEKIGDLRAEVATKGDMAALRRDIETMYRQPVQPGLLGSPQFQQLTQTLRDTEQAFAGARTGLTALETAIAQNPVLATSLTIPLGQAQQLATATDAQQQQARQNLLQFMADVAATQRAIMDATSHRADVARQLFEQGQFTEANAALSADELRRDKTDLLQQRDAVRAQLAQLAQDFILKANMMVLAKDPDWFAQARQLFEEAVETDQTYETCFALGYFLQEHNQHLDAMVWYEKALPLSANESPKSALLNNLANLYSDNKRFAEAEPAFDEALTVYRQLAQQNPLAYLPKVATTLNNLANLYSDTQRFAEAEPAYDKALTIRRQLAQQNPSAYLPDVAMTLNNLGILYSDTQRFAEAEAAFDEALTIRRQLAQQNPSAYLPDVAMTLNNLAVLYRANKRFAEAEPAFDEALTIRRQLAQQNPSAYLPDVAMTLNNLGILYSDNKRFAEAEAAYDEALTVYQQLAQQNPSAYLPDVAMTLNNLANLYKATNRPERAEEAYDEGLGIYRGLAKVNPDSYSVNAAMTAVNRSMLYRDQPTPDQEQSVEYALLALFYAIPYQDRVLLALKIAQAAVQICGHWGIDWQAELQKRFGEGES
ncbi:MAG: tetratricopeptide repeat protein [Spirosoma sp.]|nr:tetratricopeptide repeat protein [Spirosoma sp.]